MIDPLIHRVSPGIEPTFSWILIGFLTCWFFNPQSESRDWTHILMDTNWVPQRELHGP